MASASRAHTHPSIVVCACSFAELSKVLEPGKAAKTDKSSIITDAIRIVTQLRAENGQLRQLNKFLEVPALLHTHRSHTACNLLQPALIFHGGIYACWTQSLPSN